MKSTKVIAGLGVVAALGMAVMPFAGAFAEKTGNVTVKYTINDNLSLTLNGETKTATITAGTPDTTLSSTAKVEGNSAYTLAVKSDGKDANLDNGKGATIAPMTTAAASLEEGKWGIKVATTEGARNVLGAENFNGVDTTGKVIMDRQTLTGLLPTDGDIATVTYGVHAADNQSAGVYQDTLIYTVAAVVSQ
jgi:hypothetical protein